MLLFELNVLVLPDTDTQEVLVESQVSIKKRVFIRRHQQQTKKKNQIFDLFLIH